MDNSLIKRQAAIDALGEKPLAWIEGEYELGLQNQWEHDVNAIRALPSVQPKPKPECSCEQIKWERDMAIAQLNELGYGLGEKPRTGHWIPISERLPEALQTVLVTSKGGYVYTSCIAHGDWEYGGEVIAWQPLPKPYETQESEGKE
jgi:hypothetical protein